MNLGQRVSGSTRCLHNFLSSFYHRNDISLGYVHETGGNRSWMRCGHGRKLEKNQKGRSRIQKIGLVDKGASGRFFMWI